MLHKEILEFFCNFGEFWQFWHWDFLVYMQEFFNNRPDIYFPHNLDLWESIISINKKNCYGGLIPSVHYFLNEMCLCLDWSLFHENHLSQKFGCLWQGLNCIIFSWYTIFSKKHPNMLLLFYYWLGGCAGKIKNKGNMKMFVKSGFLCGFQYAIKTLLIIWRNTTSSLGER